MKQYFCVGTYTEPIVFGTGEIFRGKGKGLTICMLEDGAVQILSSLLVRNPSYLCLDKKKKKIYTVNETKKYLDQDGGGMTQVSYDDQWNMREEATCNIGGSDPCHILLAPNGAFLSIANFASGSVTSVPVDQGGNIETGHLKVYQQEGSGVHPVRQKGPHAHATIAVPGKSMLYVPDLGTDMVVAYGYDSDQMERIVAESIRVPGGSGPRTGIFSGDGRNFYLLCEISSQVIHFRWEEKGNLLAEKETVSTLPEGYIGDNIGSDIHLTPDGAFLYASNRGHDSLVCYQVLGDGSLKLLGHQNCHGKTPRCFAIDPTGACLLCGNQDSDTITIFNIRENGTLVLEREMAFETPVCIRFFE